MIGWDDWIKKMVIDLSCRKVKGDLKDIHCCEMPRYFFYLLHIKSILFTILFIMYKYRTKSITGQECLIPLKVLNSSHFLFPFLLLRFLLSLVAEGCVFNLRPAPNSITSVLIMVLKRGKKFITLVLFIK